MGIIKLDIKTFLKPIIIYILITQLLIFGSTEINKLVSSSNSVIFEYFIIFILALCIITVVVYTILFAIYFNTRSNTIHAKEFQITDGYGLYRFITTLGFIVILAVNLMVALELNGFEIIESLLMLKYYEFAASLFFLIPLFAIVIITIGHTHGRRLLRNLEAMISLTAILIGIYVAGNLYYFGNQQQGVAVLFILFIPLAILFMSLKERNSELGLYKIVILILCILVGLISSILVITSDFEYDTDRFDNYGEQYQPVYDQYTNEITSDLIPTEYGEVLHIVVNGDDSYYREELYTLSTDDYLYRLEAYGPAEHIFSAYQIGSSNYFSISDSDYQTEAEVHAEIYNQDTNKHTSCSTPISLVGSNNCEIDPKVIDVYQAIVELD